MDDLALDTLPPEYKKEGTDWFAIFNPSVKRVLDVDLKYTFAHERHVPTFLFLHFKRVLTFSIVSYVVSVFQQMESTLLQVAIVLLRFTTRRLVPRLGTYCSHNLVQSQN